MGAVWRYLRQHPWQRRSASLLLAAVLGIIAAWFLWPLARDYRILWLLESDNPRLRAMGLRWFGQVAPSRPALVKLVARKLSQQGDAQFLAMSDALSQTGRFGDQHTPPELMDRWRAVNLEMTANDPASQPLRLLLLHGLILADRDNAHVRRALAWAVKDRSEEVRANAGVLAVKLGDEPAVRGLLNDASACVRAAAAIDAGAGGMKGLTDAIAARLFLSLAANARWVRPDFFPVTPVSALSTRSASATSTSQPWASWCDEESSYACALAMLIPGQFAGVIASSIDALARSPALEPPVRVRLNRLLYVASLLPAEQAGPTVLGCLQRGIDRGEPVPMAFIAAGRLKLPAAIPLIQRYLGDTLAGKSVGWVTPDSSSALPTRRLSLVDAEALAAACWAAGKLKAPVAPELAELMYSLWHERTTSLMLLAAEAAGEIGATGEHGHANGGVAMPPGQIAGATATSSVAVPASKGVGQDKRSLRSPADHNATKPGVRQDGAEGSLVLPYSLPEVLAMAAQRADTPLSAAAAAVALFRLRPHEAVDALRQVCESETYLAGDYVAWQLYLTWKTQPALAPAAASAVSQLWQSPLYSEPLRASSAMALALLAHGGPQADQAAKAIGARLAAAGAAIDPILAGSYRCALLILGQQQHQAEVASLWTADVFPKSRVLIALAMAAEPAGLDLALASEQFLPERMDSLLAGRLMDRVYATVVPELPAFDFAAPASVRTWQCRIIRDYYLIHRKQILGRLGSPG